MKIIINNNYMSLISALRDGNTCVAISLMVCATLGFSMLYLAVYFKNGQPTLRPHIFKEHLPNIPVEIRQLWTKFAWLGILACFASIMLTCGFIKTLKAEMSIDLKYSSDMERLQLLGDLRSQYWRLQYEYLELERKIRDKNK